MGDQIETEAQLRKRCREEREEIVKKYDTGREEGAQIDDWEDAQLEIYHIQDRYGFLHDNRLPETGKRSAQDRALAEIERSRALKWAEMIKKEKKFFGPDAKNREKMIERLHKGVPLSVRGRLWYILLDIDRLKREQKGVYSQMRSTARKISPDIRQIDLDVNRTYRDHVMFRERYNVRQRALFHVLAAYSMYNTEVGYCQGMSQIAALLLMFLEEEEDAFWGLSQLMAHPKYAMHGFFIQGFPKLIRFQTHHDKVLKRLAPKLKKHFDRQGVDSGIYTLKWFFQCFLDRLPFTLTLRVWDLYLLEGERVLIAMAYNILKMHRKHLLKYPMDEIIEVLQIKLAKNFGYSDDDVINTLRETMYDLRSRGLDYPGRPPPEELPQKPFGIVPTSLTKYELPTIERELGLRSGFTDEERKYSEYTISKQNEVEKLIRDEEDRAFYEDGSDVCDDTSSLPGDSITQPTNDGDDYDDDDDVVVPGDYDTSFDASDLAITERSKSNAALSASKSPLPLSDAHLRLDESVQFMLKSASDLNGRPASVGQQSRSGSRCVSNPPGGLDTSFESNPGDVVRIRVPYRKSTTASPTSPTLPDFPRYEGNKILITVNHNPPTPTNSSPDFSTTSTKTVERSPTSDVPNSTFRQMKLVDNDSPTRRYIDSNSRREVHSYHHESFTSSSYTSKMVSSSSASTTYLEHRQMSPLVQNSSSPSTKSTKV